MPTKYKTEAMVQLGEIAFSQIAGEPETVLLQQAHQVIKEIKGGLSFKDAASKNGTESVPREIGRLGSNGIGKRNKK